MIDARVKPAHDDRINQTDLELYGIRLISSVVIAGLDPAIHLFFESWITGSRRGACQRAGPVMTPR